MRITMPKKQVTIEDLAGMVKHGFDAVDLRFDKMDTRFDRIERIVLASYNRRIERLDEEVRDIKSLFAMK